MSAEEPTTPLVSVHGMYAAMFGLFAGFTFTATLFLIQAKLNFPFYDYFIGACGSLTINFIFVTISYSAASLWRVRGQAERARKFYVAAQYMGISGLLGLIALIILILFFTSPIAGAITFVVFLVLTFGNAYYFGRTPTKKIK